MAQQVSHAQRPPRQRLRSNELLVTWPLSSLLGQMPLSPLCACMVELPASCPNSDRFAGQESYLPTLDSAMLRKTFVMLSAPPSER
jgi:hypothetical protein